MRLELMRNFLDLNISQFVECQKESHSLLAKKSNVHDRHWQSDKTVKLSERTCTTTLCHSHLSLQPCRCRKDPGADNLKPHINPGKGLSKTFISIDYYDNTLTTLMQKANRHLLTTQARFSFNEKADQLCKQWMFLPMRLLYVKSLTYYHNTPFTAH